MYQASLEAAAAEAEAAPSGSDDEGAQPVTADSIIFEGMFCNPEDWRETDSNLGSPKKKPKRKRGGQAARGRARAKPLYFEPSLFQDEQLLAEFKKRVEFTDHNFVTFFTDKSVCPYLS